MGKRMILVIVLILFSFFFSFADKVLDFATVDRESYQLYEARQWGELTVYGENAILAGFDYYNLRMRIGISYYQLREYLHAIAHFRKALEFNDHDETATEYLYYSCLFSNKSAQTLSVLKNAPPSLKEKIKSSGGPEFSFVNLCAGYLLSDERQKANSIDLDGPEDVYGEMEVTNSGMWLNTGLRYQFSGRVSSYLSYLYLVLDKTKLIQIGDIQTVKDNFRLDQHQLYINSQVQLGEGFSILPAFHYIRVNSSTVYPVYLPDSNKYNYPENQLTLDNYIAYLAVVKDFQLITTSLFCAWSNLNNDDQFQAGFSMTAFPMGNLDFYATSTLLNHNSNGENNLIFDQIFGFRIAKPLWMEIYATFGNLHNYYEQSALVVYNIPDKIDFKAGGRLMLKLSKRWLLTLDYEYLERQGNYLVYKQSAGDSGLIYSPEYVELKYNNHLISGGIRWKF
jgi:hypothetical protein